MTACVEVSAMAKMVMMILLAVSTAAVYFVMAEAKVTAVIVFGDSTVDTGNNNYIATVARSNFRPYGRDLNGGTPTGRFSNGRLAVDFVSEAFGLPPTIPAYLDPQFGIAQLATGVCFASAATGYDDTTSDILSVVSVRDQLKHFVEYKERLKNYAGEQRAEEIIAGALFVVSLGTNDFIENYYGPRPGGPRTSYPDVNQYEGHIAAIAERFVRDLYGLGMRKLDVTGIPPMGCLPLERETNGADPGKCNEEYNFVARQFNARLQTLVSKMNGELPGMNAVYADCYTPFADVLKNPSAFGFEDAESSCCGTGFFSMGMFCSLEDEYSCPDAGKYVFFDAIHPTERMYKIIADSIMSSALHVFL